MINSYRQKGLTLVELMIALTLSLLLLAGVIQVFIANNQSYRMTEAHARLQENARFALNILTRDVRGAGYSGCRTIENVDVVTIANSPVQTMNANTIVTGVNDYTASSVAGLGAVIGGTDSITIQRGDSCGGTLTGNVTSSNANIKIVTPNSCNIVADSVVMISDCEMGHIFRANNAPGGGGGGSQTITHPAATNQTTHLCKDYGASITTGACAKGEEKIYNYDAEIFVFRSFTYYIRNGENGDPALWRYDQSNNVAVELLEGIEDMQITYGVDSDDDDIVDNYQTANTITTNSDWDKVVSARISLLVQTAEENIATSNQTVFYNGADRVIPAGKLARVFTSTIGIRNRVQ